MAEELKKMISLYQMGIITKDELLYYVITEYGDRKFKITMTYNNDDKPRTIDMPLDQNLDIEDAMFRQHVYKKRNKSAVFNIVVQ